MKITVFFNTDGFLGGWAIKDSLLPDTVTPEHMKKIIEKKPKVADLVAQKELIQSMHTEAKKIFNKTERNKMEADLMKEITKYKEMSRGVSISDGLPITTKMIDEAKAQGKMIVVEMPDNEMQTFHAAIDCRDGIEILPSSSKTFDAEFGNLKLKFTQDQNAANLKKSNDAMKRVHESNKGIKTKHDEAFKQIWNV